MGSGTPRFGQVAGGLVLCFGLAATPALPLRADDGPPAKLEGAAAWQSIVGNTIVTTSKTGAYTEFFEAGGAVRHVDGEGKASGKWALQGDKVCFDYPDEDDHTCVTLQVTGSKGIFIDEDGGKDLFDILPGNAKNL